jgi:hypothetical protein
MSVTRLPVQHKQLPHCPSCNRQLPSFKGAVSITQEEAEVLLAVTFRVRCACGLEWDLTRTARGA